MFWLRFGSSVVRLSVHRFRNHGCLSSQIQIPLRKLVRQNICMTKPSQEFRCLRGNPTKLPTNLVSQLGVGCHMMFGNASPLGRRLMKTTFLLREWYDQIEGHVLGGTESRIGPKSVPQVQEGPPRKPQVDIEE